MLSSVMSESKNASQKRRPFPFEPGDVLPWWKVTEEFQPKGDSVAETKTE
jgi:hypothetical protein